jgi:hypothetical protein
MAARNRVSSALTAKQWSSAQNDEAADLGGAPDFRRAADHAGGFGWRRQLTDFLKFSVTVAMAPSTTSECSLSKTIRDVFSSTLTT